MCGDAGLDEKGGPFWIDSTRNVLSSRLPSIFCKFFWVLGDGQRVKIHDAEDRVVGFLHLNPLQESTCVISKVK